MNRLDEIRTRVSLQEHEVLNATSTNTPGTYSGYDDSWSQKKFEENFQINIIRIEKDVMEFDMVGIDAAIANAFRRILLVEVPSMAIDRVLVYNNTSVMPDEMLAHRLGLVPFKADFRNFPYRMKDSEEGSPADTLQFHLKVKCQKSRDEPAKIIHRTVTSNDIKWVPIGDQKDIYKEEDVGPVHRGSDSILICKMVPGQEIDVRMHVFKGIGSDHAKFSPVATAFYRMLPEIILLKEFTGQDAHDLKKCFAPGVIEVDNINGREVARVACPRKDLCNREFMRDDRFRNNVKLNRVRNHFIYSVESTGALPPQVLVSEAIKILADKCKFFIKEIDGLDKK